MDAIWTGMIVFYSLLFTVALLLFTCLCILCKRKHRKTRDVNQQTTAASQSSGTTSERSTRSRPSLANLCGDVDSTASVEAGDQEDGGAPSTYHPVSTRTQLPAGRVNLMFESDEGNLPPGYDEALKSKYAKVYSIYPSLGSLRRASAPASLLPPSFDPAPASTSSGIGSSCSPSTSVETVLSRIDLMESPPPPYDLAVRFIDSRGHF